MTVPVEAGARPENGARDQSEDLPAPRDVSINQGSDIPDVRSRYARSNSNNHLAVHDVRQLPSPSPSPSPRSSSPSLVVTDSSAEWTGTLSSVPYGHKYSGSFEKSSASVSREYDEAVLASPLPISKTLPPHELHDIPEEKIRKPRKLSNARSGDEKILKLSAAEMEELTSAPESLPITSPARLSVSAQASLAASPVFSRKGSMSDVARPDAEDQQRKDQNRKISTPGPLDVLPDSNGDRRPSAENAFTRRPGFSSRTISTPPTASNRMSSYKGPSGQTSPKRKPILPGARPEPLDLNSSSKPLPNGTPRTSIPDQPPSPMPQSIPLPPMSIPTYLQLELSSSRPSPLYIYRSAAGESPYESSKIKFERLLNFLLLPPQLEQVLYFGSLACLDAWLYTFTILPLRFLKAAAILIKWWGEVLTKEARFISSFIYHGTGRMLERQRDRRGSTESAPRSRSVSRARRPPASTTTSYQSHLGRTPEVPDGSGTADPSRAEVERKSRQGWTRKHRRTRSHPSSLSSDHKADLLQGAVIICSCMILMNLDASRMYHNIKGQAAIKLYVIFNMLEVCDKLLSALGQDIFECLFSDETLERDLDGRSKILRPLGMFVLALIYNVIHASALFYQVVALNVAINSYSNALLTLLLSGLFVEIKSSVFKKIEKDNLFQLTCADVVERFQLWLMLLVIALRNIVEVGGLSLLNSADGAADFVKEATAPLRTSSILPNSFTILPIWSGEVLSPFLVVIGSEMIVDWIKHSYICKFNNVKPAVYQRYLDVLAKDYYTNAFVNQNLMKRLGFPVIPLSCLFIRSSVQTYHMFLATHLPPPIPSTATDISADPAESPVTTAAFEHFDKIIRRALGRSTFGIPDPTATGPWYLPSADDVIAALTMLIFFLGAFFVLLACKLVLGMLLLKFARNRYRDMKKREQTNYDTGGKRLGGWGVVEVDDDKKRWIYEDDMETLKRLKEKERAAKEKTQKGEAVQDFGKIDRFDMVKRIW